MKLGRRDFVWDLLIATREIKPYFYLNESLTPARNKILYDLYVIMKRCGDIIAECYSSEENVPLILHHHKEGAVNLKKNRWG